MTALLLVPSVALLASKRKPPLSRAEVAQVWIGPTEDESYILRLDLDAGGGGRGAYVFVDDKPLVFTVARWRYDPAAGPGIDIDVVPTPPGGSVRHLKGRVLDRRMELEFSGEGWRERASLRPEGPLERRWQALRSAMAPDGGAPAH